MTEGELTFDLVGPTGIELQAWTQDDGSQNRLEKLDGWLDGADARSEQTDLLGDGVLSGRVTAAGRKITAGGIWRNLSPDDVVRLQRLIAGIFGDGENDSTGTLTVSLGNETLSAQVQRDGSLKIEAQRLQGWIRWELPMLAPDPHLYGPPQTVQLTPEGSGGGLQYPLHTGTGKTLVYAGATGLPATMLDNPGTAAAWPTFEIVGSFPAGFRVSLGDAVIEYPYATFPQSPITVDMSGHLWLADRDIQSMLTSRQWASVPPGDSASARFTPLQANGSGVCTVTIRPTYI